MKGIAILIFSGLLCLEANGAVGNRNARAEDAKLTKEVERGYKVKPDISIDLTNKYGQIVVNTWDRDSVGVRVIITVNGKNDYEVQRQMDRINFSFRHTLNFLTVETQFDQGSSMVKELWNSVSDASRSLSSKAKVSVDYEIFVPTYSALAISNKFGDIYVNQHKGKLRIDLNHGDLMASHIYNFTDVSIGYGKAKIESIVSGKIVLRGASLDLLKADQLEIMSSSSDLSIGDVAIVQIDSKNDKVRIDNLKEISGKGYFTDIRIQRLTKSIDMGLFYGGLNVAQMESSFSRVRVNSKSAGVLLNLDMTSNFNFQLVGRDERVYLPAELKDLKRAIDSSNEKNILLTGQYGYKQPYSNIDIAVDNGDIVISMNPTVPYTTNKK